MAIVTGRIIHDLATEFQGEFKGSAPLPLGGFRLATSNGGGYPFCGVYCSEPLDFAAMEASSVGAIGSRRAVFPLEPGKTLGLWAPKLGNGMQVLDDSGNGRTGILSNSTMWASAGAPFAPPDAWALLMKGNQIDFGPGSDYPLTDGMSLDLALIVNAQGAGQQFADPSANVVYTFGNYSSNGGMKLEISPYYDYYNYQNGTYGWAWSYHRVTATVKTTLGNLTVSLTTAPLSPGTGGLGPFNSRVFYSASWDGSNLTVSATDGTNLCTAGKALLGSDGAVLSNSSARMTCAAAANGVWNLNSNAMFFGARVSNYAVPPSDLKRDLIALIKNDSKVVFQTRSAPASGAFTHDWLGNANDRLMPRSFGLGNLEPVSELTFGPNLSLLDAAAAAAGASAFASSVYPNGEPFRAFNGSVADFWQSNIYTNSTTPLWLAYDFGPGKAYHIRRMRVTTKDTLNIIRRMTIQNSDDGVSWQDVHLASVTTTATTFVVDLPASRAARYWRLLSDSSVGTASYALICELQLLELVSVVPQTAQNIALSFDTTMPFSGSGSVKLAGTENSAAKTIGIRIPTTYLRLADFLTMALRCDNPSAVFRIRLHTNATHGVPNKTDASQWAYEFRLSDSGWQELFLPDYVRTSILQAGADASLSGLSFWLTLEVVRPAGGFNLWFDQVRFGTGLGQGEPIQSLFQDWFQYRAILLTAS